MVKKPLDKEDLKRRYTKICPKYERLAKNLKDVFEILLEVADIDVLGIHYRVKDFDSFWDKILRKGYNNPFKEIEDICGLRIICSLPSDLEKISEIIKREFDVKESIDKTDLLKPDQFGYRSVHFILTIKKEWLKVPNYRGLGDIKAEVQLRTILMHAWADIEHKLAYKKEEYVPDQLRRNLSQISALLESADDQFDNLWKRKEEYREDISKEAKKSGRFDVSQEINIDSLQALLDFLFPRRDKSLKNTSVLLDEILRYNLSIREIVEAFEKVNDILPKIETEPFEHKKKDKKWSQVGILRRILELTNDDYWQSRKKLYTKSDFQKLNKWREKVS